MNVCTLTESGQGGGKLFVSVDPAGTSSAAFARIIEADIARWAEVARTSGVKIQ